MVNRLDSTSSRTVKLWPIALLRVYAGIYFAWYGLLKLRNANFADGVERFLTANLDSAFAFYRPFAESVVIPHKSLFAALVGWGELAIGLALIVGLGTRYAAFCGVFITANVWFAQGQGVLAAGNNAVFWMLILLVLAFIPAGRVAGMDAGLADRLPFLR